jgi:hypothetical protein
MQPDGPISVALPDAVSPDDVERTATADVVDIPLALEFDPAAPERDPIRQYVMNVALVLGDSLAADAEGVRDLQFGVMWCRPGGTIMDGPSFDRNFVAGNLSNAQRAALVDRICEAVHLLLRACEPPLVTMSTWQTHLPAAARVKFERIAQACAAAGWQVADAHRDDSGRDHWVFRTGT